MRPADRERLVERAAELLRVAPPISQLQNYRLTDMQAATLALYDELITADSGTADRGGSLQCAHHPC